MYLCITKIFGNSGNGVALVAIFMFLRGLIKLKNLGGQYMNFIYESRHQAHLKDCFSAFSNFVHTPFCRLPVLGGREPYAHAGTCLGFLVYVAFSYSHLLSAIRNTDYHRDYSTSKMDFTSMSAHGNLAGYRNFFLYWPANLCFCLVRWSFIQVEKDLVFSGAVHA